IRELYDLVARRDVAIILYYGPTGVGKSSVLDAGLLPRLEEHHQVSYLRRDPELGLLGTLRQGLAPDGDQALFNPGNRWTEIERDDARQRPLVLILDQVEEAFTRPLIVPPPGGDEVALRRPWIDPKAEIGALIKALCNAFADPTRSARPRGTLILGFRKEWL